MGTTELWNKFVNQLKELHCLFTDKKNTHLKRPQIRNGWIAFCKNFSVVLDPRNDLFYSNTRGYTGSGYNGAGNNSNGTGSWGIAGITPGESLNLPIFSIQKSQLAINSSPPWNLLSFTIQFEICSKRFKSMQESLDLLYSFRISNQWNFPDFYSNLFAAILKTEFQFYKKSLKNSKITEWYRCLWFLFSRLPILIRFWEQQHLGEENDLFYQQKHDLNHVEQAILYISYFPNLYLRPSPSSLSASSSSSTLASSSSFSYNKVPYYSLLDRYSSSFLLPPPSPSLLFPSFFSSLPPLSLLPTSPSLLLPSSFLSLHSFLSFLPLLSSFLSSSLPSSPLLRSFLSPPFSLPFLLFYAPSSPPFFCTPFFLSPIPSCSPLGWILFLVSLSISSSPFWNFTVWSSPGEETAPPPLFLF